MSKSIRGSGLLGQRFGRLLVLEWDRERSRKGVPNYYICRCDCGNIKSLQHAVLKQLITTHCGCQTRQRPMQGKSDIAVEQAPETITAETVMVQKQPQVSVKVVGKDSFSIELTFTIQISTKPEASQVCKQG